MAIKLIVADDQEVIRRGLASILAGEDIEIVAEAVTGKEAISKTKKHKPDVVLMDVLMPDIDGLDALERIRKNSPATKVVMMSARDNPSYVARAAALALQIFCPRTSRPRRSSLRSSALSEGKLRQQMRP